MGPLGGDSDVREFCGEEIFDDDVCLVGAEMR